MKITYITHACVMVEAGGVRLLMDPWLAGPCWGGNLWHYPPPRSAPEDFSGINCLYFSHAHDDHLHPASLRRLPPEVKRARVLIPDFGAPYFEKAVRANGFDNPELLRHGESRELAPGVRLEMLVNDRGDHDSSVLVQADGATVFFQTDSQISLAEAKRIGGKQPIDAAFTIASLTGIFPGFFDFPVETMVRLAREKRARAVANSLDVVTALGARLAIPYASDLCYLGDLHFANDLHKADKRDFEKLARERKAAVETVLMGPGDRLEISGDGVRRELSEHDFGMEALAAYAVAMRHEVSASRIQERSHAGTPYDADIGRLRAVLDQRASRWQAAPYRVLWRIVGERGEIHAFGQALPGATEACAPDWPYDLAIEMPSYRLQRLTRGDYKMGFVTLWNGGVRCHRHVLNLTSAESGFWNWAFSGIHFAKAP